MGSCCQLSETILAILCVTGSTTSIEITNKSKQMYQIFKKKEVKQIAGRKAEHPNNLIPTSCNNPS